MLKIFSIFTIIKNVILTARYFFEIKAKGIELSQVYEAQDREEKINEKILEFVRKKGEATKKGDKVVADYYSGAINAWKRKLRIHQQVCGALEKRLTSRDQGDD